jgi:hypothetical protein
MSLSPGYHDCLLSPPMMADALRNLENAGMAFQNNVSTTKLVEYVTESSIVTCVGGVTNLDTTLFSFPQGGLYLITGVILRFTTTVAAGAGLTSAAWNIGTTAGGGQFLATQTVLTANLGTTSAAGANLGLTVAQLGTSLPSADGHRGFVDTTSAAVNVVLRQTNTGGAVGTTAGACKVFVFWKKIALR